MDNTRLDPDPAASARCPDIERIASPTIGLPSTQTPGSNLFIDVFAEQDLPADRSGWNVRISRGVRRIRIGAKTTVDDGTYYYDSACLPVLDVVNYEPYRYRLEVQIPPDSQTDLYDLTVQVDGKEFTQENAVQFLNRYPSEPRFCLMSDPHIGFDGYPCIDVPSVDEIAIFAAGIEHVNQVRPDFVIILGDLVDWSCSGNWSNLRNLLKLFQVPVYTLVGNHDYYWDNWWIGYPPLLPPPVRCDPVALRYYQRHINPCTRFSFDYGPLHAICLDSGDDAILSAVEAFGSGLTDDDIRWLEDDLEGREGSFVFMHHPATRAGCTDEQRRQANTGCITSNRRQFMNLCSKHDVVAVFSGHEHMDEYWAEGGVDYYSTPSVARSGDANGYRIVRLTADGRYVTEVTACLGERQS
jgi:hypothetical protein